MITPIRFASWCSTALRNAAPGLLIALCMLGFGLTASAQESHIITFEAPGADTTPGSFNGTFATDVNNRGFITGYYVTADTVSHGFLRSPDGKFTTFEDPDADTTPGSFNGTAASSINDLGVITGNYFDANGFSHGFVRSSDGSTRSRDVRRVRAKAAEQDRADREFEWQFFRLASTPDAQHLC